MEQRIEFEEAAAKELPPPLIDEWVTNHRRKLKLLLSTHVDDLKGVARRQVAEQLLKHLETHFGPCKAEWGTFLHTGIKHMHSPGRVECHQNDYIDSLRPMSVTHLRGKDDSELVDTATHSGYSTLLGGAAWPILTRGDAAIFVQALQRRSHAPRVVDCRRLNVVVRYMQRDKVSMIYEFVPEPHRILGYSDSAFKAQEGEASGLAVRSLAACLATDTPKGEILTCKIHLLEMLVRRLKRVMRSTYATELGGLVDSIESLILMQLILHQVYFGTDESSDVLLQKLATGSLYPPIDILIDARSVYDNLSCTDLNIPSESSLVIHVLNIRDRLKSGTIRRLGWCDTRDMLADGLNKGTVDRSELVRALSGTLRAPHEAPVWTS